MALSQLFWDVLMPWNLKSTYFSLKMIHFLSLNIWYVIYVVFWIKYWNLKLPHHCILFLFTICTVSQLFWNRVCMFKWKRKEAVVFDIIFHPIVNTVRKIAVAEASWLMLSSTLLFAELPNLRRPVRGSSVELAKSELPRTQVRNLCTWY